MGSIAVVRRNVLPPLPPQPPFPARTPVIWLDPSYGVTPGADAQTGAPIVNGWQSRGSLAPLLSPTTPTYRAPFFRARDPVLGGRPTLIAPSGPLPGGMVQLSTPTLSSRAQPNTTYAVGYVTSSTGALPSNANFIAGPIYTQTVGILNGSWRMDGGAILYSLVGSPGPHVICAIFAASASQIYIDSSAAPVASGNAGNQVSTTVYACQSAPTIPAGDTNSALVQGITVTFSGADSPAQIAEMFAYLGDVYTQPWS